MSSTEHAPEPTMDEILASIRRIIADDEPQPSSRPGAKPATPPRREPTGAPSRPSLTDDLAEVLRAREPQPPAGVEDVSDVTASEDDILELTDEVLTLPPLTELAPEPDPEPIPEPVRAPEPVRHEPVRARHESPPLPPRADLHRDEPAWNQPPIAPAPEEVGDENRPRSMAMARIAEAAALRRKEVADQDAAHHRGEGSRASSAAEPSWASEPEDALLDPDGALSTVSWDEERKESREPTELNAARPAANAGATTAGKSLEDSVREMLRPLLREWLDDNLPRILESAVRDELAAQVQDKRRKH